MSDDDEDDFPPSRLACPKCQNKNELEKSIAGQWVCYRCHEVAVLTCPKCWSTHINPPHGYKLASCLSCGLAFDTME